jgi:hypothetical protein
MAVLMAVLMMDARKRACALDTLLPKCDVKGWNDVCRANGAASTRKDAAHKAPPLTGVQEVCRCAHLRCNPGLHASCPYSFTNIHTRV